MKFITSKISYIVLSIIILQLFTVHINDKLWKKERWLIYWDVISYYAYLPATVIYDDITLEFTDENPKEFKDKFWPSKTPTGGKAIKTSMGLSYLYAPFFFLGHAGANIFGYDTDGFSDPYEFALLMSSFFYLIIGLFFLNKVLLRYFSPLITAMTLIATFFGTNLYFYSTGQPTMSHAYNFSIIAVYLFLIIKWHEKQSIKHTVFIGLLTGLIVLIRPTNIIVVFLFLLYDIKSAKDIGDRIKLFKKAYIKLIIILFLAFIVWVPQMLYWKIVSGQYLYFSYGNEGFFFNNPQIVNGLFGYRSGWLLYTPIMIFAIIGIIVLRKRLKPFFLPILVFLIINIYIITSWWNWWYGGSFGLRAFIDSYSIMAIPLAALITWLLSKKLVFKIITYVIYATIIFYSMFQNAQYHFGSIHVDSMTKEAYWENFLKRKPTDKYWQLLEKPDYAKATRGIYEPMPKEEQ